ncbi:hypothetical protein, partial [Lactobacillus intestinalis]|uniref:hypothetical protein n=1 Tax=Lactobacillus intestinalis TaxID=151781 RepID=UPI00272AF229
RKGAYILSVHMFTEIISDENEPSQHLSSLLSINLFQLAAGIKKGQNLSEALPLAGHDSGAVLAHTHAVSVSAAKYTISIFPPPSYLLIQEKTTANFVDLAVVL